MPSKVQKRKMSKVSIDSVFGKNKAVLLFGFADFCLMYAVNNHRLLYMGIGKGGHRGQGPPGF